MKELFELFFSFCQIGGLTFGGGYAMLPMLQREVVENKGWATEEELMDYYAIGQCTPGVIAVNTATFVGYKRRGILGAVFATVGVIFPSWIIITVIALFLKGFQDNPIVAHCLAGINVCVVALVFSAVVKLGKKSLSGIQAVVIFGAVLALGLFTDISSVGLILLSALAGVISGAAKGRR